MSTYDYKCEECQHIQEEMHGMKEEPSIQCEECSAPCKKTVTVMHIDSYFDGNNYEDTLYRRFN